MGDAATIQVYRDRVWRDAATVELRGLRNRGIGAATVAAYAFDYAIDNQDRRDAAALSWTLPVLLDIFPRATWPSFLVDLLAQGYGRQELLRQLGLAETAGAEADWQLLLAGAGNPVGHLRIKEAHDWLAQRTPSAPARGFTFAEVAARGEDFTEFLASHGLFVAGSSGVQGEWPKLLLTESRDGLLYLDHLLPDTDAVKHWLVKFGRGPNAALASILRQEAPYMRLAKHLGLRVHGDIELRDRALFIPRFDRVVTTEGVERVAQESMASLCELAEFGAAPTHCVAVKRLAEAATAPEVEIIEYVKRDVANVVLGNKDNHGRNTAIHRLEDGTVRLTPVFDFAPMLLHPDGIPRRTRWERDDNGAPRWASVVEQCKEATGLELPNLAAALHGMHEHIADLPEHASTAGVDEDLVRRLKPIIDDVSAQLGALRHG